MRRHFNDRGELYAVTLTHSEWDAFEASFRSADGEEPSIRTWCPKQGAVTVRANIVAFGDPTATPEEFLAAVAVKPIAYRSAATATTVPTVSVIEEVAHVDATS